MFRGFAAKLPPAIVDRLRESPDVESITEDAMVRAFATVTQ